MARAEETFADCANHPRGLLLIVIGKRPESRPYLCIEEAGCGGDLLATVTHPAALRALARRILRALGEEAKSG